MQEVISVAPLAGWAALHTLQYGFGISAFNGIQDSVICPIKRHESASRWLQPCVSISANQFGLIVAIFTLGGLVGSLSADPLMKRFGKVGVLRTSAVGVLIGSALTGVANSFAALLTGRVIIGLGCGLATVTVPLYLSEIAPASIKKSLGIANQFFIVIGILIGQSLSFPFNEQLKWRWVLAVGCGIAILQLIGSAFVPRVRDEPTFEVGDESEPLLPRGGDKEKLSIAQLFTTDDKAVSRGFALVVITQMVQQLCGISPVMYFSTGILKPIFQDYSKYIALCIVILKIPITTVPAFLIERIGSKPILLASSLTMSLSALLLAIGLNTDAQALSVFAILSFVAAFSIGLGPVTWVVLPEVMPSHAVTAAGSIGLALNWSLNFALSSVFLPLKDALSGGREEGQGNVFYLFSALCLVGFVGIWMGYRAREKA